MSAVRGLLSNETNHYAVPLRVLAAVILSEIRTVWMAIADRARSNSVFPAR